MDRVLELTAVFVVSASATGLVAALLGVFHAPQIWVLAAGLTALYAWRIPRWAGGLGAPARAGYLAAVVLVALFFRLPAFHYVFGGQDEGLYVNMAAYLVHTGGLEVEDRPLEQIAGTGAESKYLAENRTDTVYVPGVYIDHVGATTPTLEFQFYHLFPVWLALFGGLFGPPGSVWALTFLSILSIVFFFRLAGILSGSEKTALVAGLALALSPLHAFFSKFPVTEVPTLAFSAMGFCLLAAYWRAPAQERTPRWLVLSAISLGGVFFTRISGFEYVPFLLALAVASLACDEDAERRRAVNLWAAAVVAIFAVSVVYGIVFSHHYSMDIYRAAFGKALGRHWRGRTVSLFGLLLLAWGGLTVAARGGGRAWIARWLVRPARACVAPALVVGILLGIRKIYLLGWTQHYASDPWLGDRWHFAGLQWNAVARWSVVQLGVYVGPLLPLCFLGLAFRRRSEGPLEFLRVFVAGFVIYFAMLLWLLPYGPYYARYLLSELVPYLLLFLVLVWHAAERRGPRRALGAVLAVSVLYGGVACAAQLGKSEEDGLYRTLARLTAHVDPDGHDLILLDGMGSGWPNTGELITPLLYTFGCDVVVIDRAAATDWSYIAALSANYDDIVLLSPEADVPQGYRLEDSVRVVVKGYKWTEWIPAKFGEVENYRLYLSRLVRLSFPLNAPQPLSQASPWAHWLGDGWANPESWGTWTMATDAVLHLSTEQLPHLAAGGILRLHGRTFVTATHPTQRVRWRLSDGAWHEVTAHFPERGTVDLDIPLTPEQLRSPHPVDVTLQLPDALSPTADGSGTDPRALGFGLETALLTEAPRTHPAPSAAVDAERSGP